MLTQMFLMSLSRWWITPKLPFIHAFPNKEERKNVFIFTKALVWKWFFHPIKRRIARSYLILLRNFFGTVVIGITGSAGKTTTKEMIFSILRQSGVAVSSIANIDPVYNIPTTILRCWPWTKYLVLEMGVEVPGEMDFYLWLAKPDIGVITNIYPTHTLFFKNVEGVAKEKGKLVKKLGRKDWAILNNDNYYTGGLAKVIRAKTVLFGSDAGIKALDVRLDLYKGTKFTLVADKDKINVQIPILGAKFVENALAAVSVARVFGFSLTDIKSGLSKFSRPSHRMNVFKLNSGAIVIDDSYNNNPAAAREALTTFMEVSGRRKRILVFGDMLELGDLEKKEHKEIGKTIGKMKLDYLVCVGQASFETSREAQKIMDRKKVIWVDSQDKATEYLSPQLTDKAMVFIKGSRSIGLDNVVKEILDYA